MLHKQKTGRRWIHLSQGLLGDSAVKNSNLYTDRFQTSTMGAPRAKDGRWEVAAYAGLLHPGQLHFLFELSHKIASKERFSVL